MTKANIKCNMDQHGETLEVVVGFEGDCSEFNDNFKACLNDIGVDLYPDQNGDTHAQLTYHGPEYNSERDPNAKKVKFGDNTLYSVRIARNIYQFDNEGNIVRHNKLPHTAYIEK